MKRTVVKGINKSYFVEVKTIGKNIAVTCGDVLGSMTSVVITSKQWEKLKKLESVTLTDSEKTGK